MLNRILCIFTLLACAGSGLLLAKPAISVTSETRAVLLGNAILEGEAYSFLEQISDAYGPRMVGTEGHRAAMDYLEARLQELGLETRRQAFSYPGWSRGVARLEMLAPQARACRAVALAYVGTFMRTEGEVAYVEEKDISKFDPEAIRGRFLLAKQNVTYRSEDMKELAQSHEVKGIFYINRISGGQLLARSANHQGEATPFPVFSITQEDGLLMKRLLEDGQQVRVAVESTSTVQPFTGENLIATLPGASGERVLLGAHFDAWDLGQGAIDNGLGVAQVYDVARLLSRHSPGNRHSVEFVWFDAEEVGLRGSRHYAENTDLSDVRVMINLDMVGRPIALNAMGFDGLVPQLEAHAKALGAWGFLKPVANAPWMGSDHHPFILKGVPAITYNAPVDAEDVRYYHDYADTFDKVDRLMLGEATGLIALLVHDLANLEERVPHLNEKETAELFRKAGLEERMRQSGTWPFGEAESPEAADPAP